MRLIIMNTLAIQFIKNRLMFNFQLKYSEYVGHITFTNNRGNKLKFSMYAFWKSFVENALLRKLNSSPKLNSFFKRKISKDF